MLCLQWDTCVPRADACAAGYVHSPQDVHAVQHRMRACVYECVHVAVAQRHTEHARPSSTTVNVCTWPISVRMCVATAECDHCCVCARIPSDGAMMVGRIAALRAHALHCAQKARTMCSGAGAGACLSGATAGAGAGLKRPGMVHGAWSVCGVAVLAVLACTAYRLAAAGLGQSSPGLSPGQGPLGPQGPPRSPPSSKLSAVVPQYRCYGKA